MIDSAARAARAAGQERTPQALRREALRALRREWMEARAGQERSASDLLQNAVYEPEVDAGLQPAPARQADHHRHRRAHP
ncbi:hypothetical protein G6F24_016463 [Rhizopus arrhizus]|nr:hypothetical protein G6F24_016463 [Rhizopus arrhizus]